MDLAEFNMTLDEKQPPKSLGPALAALWHAKHDNWDRAHEIVQDESGADCAWVHAFLHRQEGDYGNACYWYSRARKPAVAKGNSIDDEWQQIVETLLVSS